MNKSIWTKRLLDIIQDMNEIGGPEDMAEYRAVLSEMQDCLDEQHALASSDE